MYQQALRVTAARARERFEEMGRRTDEALLGGLFAKQGAVSVPVSESFRNEYNAAARAARNKVADRFVPKRAGRPRAADAGRLPRRARPALSHGTLEPPSRTSRRLDSTRSIVQISSFS